MDEVRAAVVGLGIGRANGRSLQKNPRCRVTAICDIIEWKMDDYATELPGPVKKYVDYRELCEDPDIDAVMVATPNPVHVPVALEAVKHGKHVLVTKPLADSEETASELVEAAEAAGVVNMMSLGIRFSTSTMYLKGLLDRGDLGDLYYARARSVRRSGIPDWNSAFIEPGGGAFRDMGVHVLDLSGGCWESPSRSAWSGWAGPSSALTARATGTSGSRLVPIPICLGWTTMRAVSFASRAMSGSRSRASGHVISTQRKRRRWSFSAPRPAHVYVH